jgi:hypothetical protein
MKEIVPGMMRLAVLWTPANPASALAWKAIQDPARTAGVALISVEVGGPADLERAFERIVRERADTLHPHLTLTPHRGDRRDGSALTAVAGGSAHRMSTTGMETRAPPDPVSHDLTSWRSKSRGIGVFLPHRKGAL